MCGRPWCRPPAAISAAPPVQESPASRIRRRLQSDHVLRWRGCRTLFRAAHGDRLPLPPRLAALPSPRAWKCRSSAEPRILKQNHTSTQRLPAWKAAEAGSRRGGRCGLRGRGGLGPHGRQSTTGRRLPSPWPHLPRVCFPLRRSRRSSSGMRVAPCAVRVAERALLPWVVTRGIAATLQRKVASSPALSRPQRRAVARASTKAALRKHTPKHTLVDEGLSYERVSPTQSDFSVRLWLRMRAAAHN